jgi:hypothetical protein
MHSDEDAPVAHHVEAVQEKGLQEASILGPAAREHAVDRSLERVGRPTVVRSCMREEIRGIADDRKAHSLYEACLAIGVSERRQVRTLSKLPKTSATAKPWS